MNGVEDKVTKNVIATHSKKLVEKHYNKAELLEKFHTNIIIAFVMIEHSKVPDKEAKGDC